MLLDKSHVMSGQFSSISDFINIYTSGKVSVFFVKVSHLTLPLELFQGEYIYVDKKISVILDNDFYLLHL